jgi:hypothetical protein
MAVPTSDDRPQRAEGQQPDPGSRVRTLWGHVRRYGAWRLVSLVLLTPGLLLFVAFARQPEPAPSSGPAVLIDSLLQVALLVTAVAVAGLLVPRDVLAQRAGVLAATTCLLLAIAVLMTGLWSPIPGRPRVLFWAGTAGACALGLLWWQQDVWKHVEITRSKALAGILTLAAVPLFNFWRETSYLPSQSSASLTGSIEVEAHESGDSARHLVVSAKVKNSSDVRGFIILSDLMMCHWVDEADRDMHANDPGRDNCHPVSEPFISESLIDPGVEWTNVTSVAFRPQQPFVEVHLSLASARADRLVEDEDSGRAVPCALRQQCAWTESVTLRAPSRLSSIALENLSLMYGGRGDRQYYVRSNDDLTCPAPRTFTDLEQHLGLIEYVTVWVGWPTPAEATQ